MDGRQASLTKITAEVYRRHNCLTYGQSKSVIILKLFNTFSQMRGAGRGGRLSFHFPQGLGGTWLDCEEEVRLDTLPTGRRNKTCQEVHYVNPRSLSLSCLVSRWSFAWVDLKECDRIRLIPSQSDTEWLSGCKRRTGCCEYSVMRKLSCKWVSAVTKIVFRELN